MPLDPRTYITVHDGMPDHPQIKALSDAGFRLLVSGWCWCSTYLTDGRMELDVWENFGKKSARDELVRRGRVHLVPGANFVEFHDYLQHQRSRAEVEDLRRKRVRAGSIGGRSRASAQASAQASATAFAEQELKQNPSKTQAELELEVVVVKKEEDPYVSNANENVHNITEEPRSKAYPVGVWKIAKAYAAKVNPSNPATVAGHILNATQTWDLDTIAQAIAKMAANNRPVGADSLRIELNETGCDKTGMQRFIDGTYVDHNTGIYRTSTGQIIGGGGYKSGKRMWRE